MSRADFTIEHYREILRVAKSRYQMIGFSEIGTAERFVLWRHDCDQSLNRAARLARIEQHEGIRATYFINPHSDFYNVLEKGQADIIREILSCGHDLGLHFDATYYDIGDEDELDARISREAAWLHEWFGVAPAAVSFHNPLGFLLSCERDRYGGLLNCYSGTFKTTVPYVSDSNGVWRFRRLFDVLQAGVEPRLQVLTHPDWWQERALYPRERVFRSVYGRATATLRSYDDFIDAHGRSNDGGPASNLRFLRATDAETFELYDFLWNRRLFYSLYLELHRLHLRQVSRLIEKGLNASWHEAAGTTADIHAHWCAVMRDMIENGRNIPAQELEEGCTYLCGIIQRVGRHTGIAERS